MIAHKMIDFSQKTLKILRNLILLFQLTSPSLGSHEITPDIVRERRALSRIRDDSILRIVDEKIHQHEKCIKWNCVLDTAAHVCITITVLGTTGATYFKYPWLVFASSGIGVVGMSFRSLAAYSKKVALQNLTRASNILLNEGLPDLQVVVDAENIRGNSDASLHEPITDDRI
jgi:hypothetical protein